MGKKDIEEKQFEDYNDIFADIVNVNLFAGKQIVKEKDLENAKDRSRFKSTNGVITEQERDVAKWWKKSGVRIVLIGFENQTLVDPKICFRLYGYDGAAYKSQYEEKKNYPVITLVLYFGSKRWSKPKSLGESLQVPEELKPYFNDYHMNLVEVAWQTEEQVALYRSDFKIIADYFVQKRKKHGRYAPSKDTIKHVDSMLKLMSALTNDDRFEKTVSERKKGERKVKNMCEVFDRAENKGMQKGLQKGLKEGMLSTLSNLVKKGKISLETAAQEAQMTVDQFKKATMLKP